MRATDLTRLPLAAALTPINGVVTPQPRLSPPAAGPGMLVKQQLAKMRLRVVPTSSQRTRAFSWLVTIAGIGEKVHAFCWREAGKRIGYRLVEGFESSCTGLA